MAHKRFWILGGILAVLALEMLTSWNALAGSTFLWRKHTFGNAGGRLQSSSYELNTTAGQPSMAGELSGSNFSLRAGYWSGAAPARTLTATSTATNTPTATRTPTATTTPMATHTPTATSTAASASYYSYLPLIIR